MYQPPLTDRVYPVMYSFIASITATEATSSTEWWARSETFCLSLLQIKDTAPFQTHTPHVRHLPSPNQPGATRRFASPGRRAGDLLGEGVIRAIYFARDLRRL